MLSRKPSPPNNFQTALAHCTLEALHPGGDHGIFVGRIQEIAHTEETAAKPLLYFGGRYGDFATE